MIASTLRFALRRLARRPGTTALHLSGLAVGLACCILALLFVRDELAFDRFHPAAEQIVEVHQRIQFGDDAMTSTQLPVGGLEALQTRVPGVEAVAQVARQEGLVRAVPDAAGLRAEVLFADGAFFDVFGFRLRHGDPSTALAAPRQAVVTASLARSLFGDADAMGRTLTLERTGFGRQDSARIALTVAGVAEDPPSATNLGFDLVASGTTPIEYVGSRAPALSEQDAGYVRLRALSDSAALKAALTPLALAMNAPDAFVRYEGVTTPRLVDRHLGPAGASLEGPRLYIALFAGVAALVLLLACVNYANLATALALGRATEVGVRKTLGAGRGHLARAFVVEAILLAAGAGALALVGVALALPAVNTYLGKALALGALGAGGWGIVAALVGATGLLAGAYPAAVLARFRPAAALAGAVQGRGGARVRQALVVMQFAVTAVLLTGTAVVFDQLDASRARDLGFDGDRTLTLDLHSERLRSLRGPLKQQIEAVPGVAHASLATAVPGSPRLVQMASPGDTPGDASDDRSVGLLYGDADYLAATGIRLAAGAWFAHDDAETAREVVLNETAARAFGLMTADPEAAIGQTVGRASGQEMVPLRVVGVVRDFHNDDLRAEIEPLLIEPLGESFNRVRLVVQLRAVDTGALADVEAVWARLAPDYTFEPVFLDDLFADQLREDRRLGQLFGAFGLVAVLLACMGVFGLAAHAAERRTKEVGMRKVLGASVAGLVARLSGEFARLVAVALAVAVPVTVVLARRWLEGFAYPAPLRPGPFVAVALGVLVLALLTAGVHALRAALADPVRALRSE